MNLKVNLYITYNSLDNLKSFKLSVIEYIIHDYIRKELIRSCGLNSPYSMFSSRNGKEVDQYLNSAH